MPRASFASVKGLVQHIRAYIEHWNAHPTPFVWTKEPAEIIRKALRRGSYSAVGNIGDGRGAEE